MDGKVEKAMNANLLLFSVFIISICGIMYELMIGAVSSYLLGDSVKQYSLTIGFFMSAMGIGSYLTKWVKRELFNAFIVVELAVGIIGGISVTLLFATYAYTELYHFVLYSLIILIGIFVGMEIPILTRIIEENKSNLRVTLANVLSFDYMGGLIGSILFPLILLPTLGQTKTCFLVGIINLVVANLMIWKYSERINYEKWFKVLGIFLLMVLSLGFLCGDYITAGLDDHLYRDRVVYSKQSSYQNIVMTKHKDDLRLFLDGNIQFSSEDEYRYHEALVHPAMSLAESKEEVLVLGGGDGLAVREILKYEEVENITLVELDPAMIEVGRKIPLVRELNEESLHNPKVIIEIEDAYQFLEESEQLYDIIIVDMPDPNNETLNKLYTNLFYRLAYNHLSDDGVMAVQGTSPRQTTKAYWCIEKTIASEGFFTEGYHVNVPSFGDWGFILAKKEPVDIAEISLETPTKYLHDGMIESMFSFGRDEYETEEIKINHFANPVLVHYYQNQQP